jgi:hypothetical protein
MQWHHFSHDRNHGVRGHAFVGAAVLKRHRTALGGHGSCALPSAPSGSTDEFDPRRASDPMTDPR